MELDIENLDIKKFEEYSEKIIRKSLPIGVCVSRTYEFLSHHRNKYQTLDEIANNTGLKRSEVLEGILILRDEYGIQISERNFQINQAFVPGYKLS